MNEMKRKSKFDIPPDEFDTMKLSVLKNIGATIDFLKKPKLQNEFELRLQNAMKKNLEFIQRKDDNQGSSSQPSHDSRFKNMIEVENGKIINNPSKPMMTHGLGAVETKPQKENNRVYLSGLPSDIVNEDLDILFSSQGKIKKIKIYEDSDGKKKGDALITYMKSDSAIQACLKLNGLDIGDGYTIKVVMAEYKSSDSIHHTEPGNSHSSRLNQNNEYENDDDDDEVTRRVTFISSSSASSYLHSVSLEPKITSNTTITQGVTNSSSSSSVILNTDVIDQKNVEAIADDVENFLNTLL